MTYTGTQANLGAVPVAGASQGGFDAVLAVPGDGGPVVLPDIAALLHGDYVRLGQDLLVTTPDGARILVTDFFSGGRALTDLQGPGGETLKGALVAKLAGPGPEGVQVAQEGGTAAAAPIGTVTKAAGEVFATRADGSRVALQSGDQVFQGDVLETGPDGAVGIVFIDETEFSLGGDGRMVLDEMIYDPDGGQGSSSFSLVSGTFSFVSGEIAKLGADAMQVETPVATIGIRGTKGLIRVKSEDSDGDGAADFRLEVALLDSGEIVVSTFEGTTQVINQVFTGFRVETASGIRDFARIERPASDAGDDADRGGDGRGPAPAAGDGGAGGDGGDGGDGGGAAAEQTETFVVDAQFVQSDPQIVQTVRFLPSTAPDLPDERVIQPPTGPLGPAAPDFDAGDGDTDGGGSDNADGGAEPDQTLDFDDAATGETVRDALQLPPGLTLPQEVFDALRNMTDAAGFDLVVETESDLDQGVGDGLAEETGEDDLLPGEEEDEDETGEENDDNDEEEFLPPEDITGDEEETSQDDPAGEDPTGEDPTAGEPGDDDSTGEDPGTDEPGTGDDGTGDDETGDDETGEDETGEDEPATGGGGGGGGGGSSRVATAVTVDPGTTLDLSGDTQNYDITGSDGDDTVISGSGDDIVIGDDGNDDIVANAGDDTVYGGHGSDTVTGGTGAGNDVYYGGDASSDTNADDWLRYTSADQGANVNLAAGTATGADIDSDTISGFEHVEMGAGNDTVTGDAENNYIMTGGGADLLDYTGSLSAIGQDTIENASGVDTLDMGTDAPAEIYAVDGDAVLEVDASNTIRLKSAASFGTLVMNGGTFAVAELQLGSGGNDTVTGTTSGEALFGNDGDDYLSAYAGNDLLVGGTGDDTLNGGDHDDTLEGGEGNDEYVIDRSTTPIGFDTIHDTEGLNTLDITASAAGSLKDIDRQAGGPMVLDFGIDGAVTVEGGSAIDQIILDAPYLTANRTVRYEANQFTFDPIHTNNDFELVYNDGVGIGMVPVDDVDAADLGAAATALEASAAVASATWTAADGLTIVMADGYLFDSFSATGTATVDNVPASIYPDGNEIFTSGTTTGGTIDPDVIVGHEAAESIHGGDGEDVIFGGRGDDTLDGEGDNDALWGGAGNDRYVATTDPNRTDTRDVVREAAGTDTVAGAGGLDLIGAVKNGNDLELTYRNAGDGHEVTMVVEDQYDGAAIEKIEVDGTVYTPHLAADGTGQEGNEVIVGTGSDDTIQGTSGGDDLLLGGGSNDTYKFVDGFGGNHTILDESGANVLDLSDDAIPVDVFHNGGDIAFVDALGNTLTLRDGDSAINSVVSKAGSHAFTSTMSTGNDIYVGSAGANTVDGDTGHDIIFGGAGVDDINGGDGDDTLAGGDGDDTLQGDAGDDVIVFDPTDSVISGGAHTLRDTLYLTGASLVADDTTFDAVSAVEEVRLDGSQSMTLTLSLDAVGDLRDTIGGALYVSSGDWDDVLKSDVTWTRDEGQDAVSGGRVYEAWTHTDTFDNIWTLMVEVGINAAPLNLTALPGPTWVGGSSGAFETDSNWIDSSGTAAAPSGAGVDAYIDGKATVTYGGAGATTTVNDIYLSNEATLSVVGGTLNASQITPPEGVEFPGHLVLSGGTLDISGGQVDTFTMTGGTLNTSTGLDTNVFAVSGGVLDGTLSSEQTENTVTGTVELNGTIDARSYDMSNPAAVSIHDAAITGAGELYALGGLYYITDSMVDIADISMVMDGASSALVLEAMTADTTITTSGDFRGGKMTMKAADGHAVSVSTNGSNDFISHLATTMELGTGSLSIANTGGLTIGSASFNVGANFDINGSLTMGDMTFNADVTLDIDGSLTAFDPMAGGGVSWTVDADVAVTGSGTFNIDGDATFTGGGTITLDDGITLEMTADDFDSDIFDLSNFAVFEDVRHMAFDGADTMVLTAQAVADVTGTSTELYISGGDGAGLSVTFNDDDNGLGTPGSQNTDWTRDSGQDTVIGGTSYQAYTNSVNDEVVFVDEAVTVAAAAV